DLRFARIAVDGDEVAREPGEVEVVHLALAARSKRDHFAGAGKMVTRLIARLFASVHGPLDDLLEAPPLVVAEQRLQVAGAPVFGTVLVHLFQVLEAFGARCGMVGHALRSLVAAERAMCGSCKLLPAAGPSSSNSSGCAFTGFAAMGRFSTFRL